METLKPQRIGSLGFNILLALSTIAALSSVYFWLFLGSGLGLYKLVVSPKFRAITAWVMLFALLKRLT